MKISEVISRIKAYHLGTEIDESTTRDKVLYGNPDAECTGIITTCWASVNVIKEAKDKGVNLIICHEALFWNHGDHTDCLAEQKNTVFFEKKKLLDETGIVVWRDHDYIHSGIPLENGNYVDGIFYGVGKALGWEKSMVKNGKLELLFEIPEKNAGVIARMIVEKLELDGLKVIGSLDTKVKKVLFSAHIWGDERDNELIRLVEEEQVDLILPLEVVDYTFTEYVRDSVMTGRNRVMLVTGHFNGEEMGMKYMLNYLPSVIGEKIPVLYVQSGDMYGYLTKKEQLHEKKI